MPAKQRAVEKGNLVHTVGEDGVVRGGVANIVAEARGVGEAEPPHDDRKAPSEEVLRARLPHPSKGAGAELGGV